MKSKDLCPKKEVIEIVINQMIIPILKQIELELNLGLDKLAYKCSIYVDDKEVQSQTIDIFGNQSSEKNTQPIRIRFRQIFDPGKLKLSIESVFFEEKLKKKIGFSGFTAKGSINTKVLTVKERGWTIRYNAWKWKGWF